MKYLLSFFILILSFNVRAQTGAIQVRNINPVCSVYFSIHAYDVANGNPLCGIAVNTIMLPPGGFTAPVPDWFTFTTLFPTSFTAPVPTSSTTFQWTDVSFQWYCPSPPCGAYLPSGIMSDATFSTNCYFQFNNWIGTGCTGLGTSNMVNITSTGFLDDFRIDFL